MTADKLNAKKRIDMHEEILGKIIYAIDKQRKESARELAELSIRIEYLESRQWAVRLNNMIRKVWR